MRNLQFCTDLKSGKWKDAKNAIENRENSRTRSKEGRGFENWKLVLEVLDKIFGGFFFGGLEYETFIRGVICPNLCVCLSAFF